MAKVLFITSVPYFEWRGSSIRVYFDALALSTAGHQVDLLTVPLGNPREVEGVNILRVPNILRLKKLKIGPSPAKAVFDLLLLFKATMLLLRGRYDVVHTIEDTGVIGVVVSLLFRTKLVFEKHSDPASYKGGFAKRAVMAFYRAMERMAVRRADLVICTGPGLTWQAEKMRHRGKILNIPDIPSSLSEPDSAKIKEVRDLAGAEKESDVIVTYVGSFAAYQGIDLLFDSIPVVLNRVPYARYLIIGGSAEEIFVRKKTLEQQGLDQRVRFAGHIDPDQLPTWLSASDILLSPRLHGVNTPLKLLDYCKAERAIAAVGSESNRLVLDETSAAFSAPDAESFGEVVSQLAEDKERRFALGKQARKLIDSAHNFGRFAELLGAAYKDMGLKK